MKYLNTYFFYLKSRESLFPNIFVLKSSPVGLTNSSDAAHSLISSLVQVNCVILTHHIVNGRNDRKRIALVDVLESLFSNNFVLVGMKMGILSHDQVNELFTLVPSKSGCKQDLVGSCCMSMFSTLWY